jgi:ribosomal protein L11 methyltransferase
MTGDPPTDATHPGQAASSKKGAHSTWVELSIEADGEAAEAVSAVFNRYRPGRVVFEELLPEAGEETLTRVKTFVASDQEALISKIEQDLWHLSQAYPLAALSTRQLSQSDWMDAWKADYGVQRIGRRIVVKPSWRDHADEGGSLVIEIDPGMAFGTGLHPSTRLSLMAMEKHAQIGDAVLDVGTGSGILAIAAAKMGAARVVAIDVDHAALKVALENVVRNRVSDVVSLQEATLCPVSEGRQFAGAANTFDADGSWTGAFDLLVMNILAPVIMDSAAGIADCLEANGTFVVSGLTKSQATEVRQALQRAGLDVMQTLTEQDWVALVGHLSSAGPEVADAAPGVDATAGS